MNKLIMGLSCLGVLLTVSCDNNEHSEKVAPSLGSVSFSAALKNVGITIAQGDKVILNIVDNNDSEIKYYTDVDRITGTLFTNTGKEFTFKTDGSLDGGFYLEASSDDYSITKFDLTSGGKKYELKEKVGLTVTTGQAASATVKLVEQKDGTVTGVDDKGTAVGFKVSDATNPLEIKVKFQKSDDTFFNSTDDKDVTIQFDVKDGTNKVYGISSLFVITGLLAKANLFTITLPREKDHYTNALKLTATAKHGNSSHKFADVNIYNLKAVDTLKMKVKNNAPLIKNNGADGRSGYSDNNRTFHLRSRRGVAIQVFTVKDQDNDELKTTYTWQLLKRNSAEESYKHIRYLNQPGNTQSGRITPSSITFTKYGGGIAGVSLSKDELAKFLLKVTVKTDDGLGGRDRKEYIKFYFTQ